MSKKSFLKSLKAQILDIKDESEIPEIANKILYVHGYKNRVVDITLLSGKFGFAVGHQNLSDDPGFKAYCAKGKFVKTAIKRISDRNRKWYKIMNRGKIIVVDDSQISSSYLRYDVAVCLAYYLLLNANDEQKEFYAIYSESNKDYFYMAEKLAENLLVPNDLLLEKLEQGNFNVKFLSDYFEVPESVISNIIVNRLKKYSKK